MGVGNTGCNAVPPGSFTLLGQQSICQRGSTCQGANKPPRQCPTGTYTNSTGSVSCIPCSPGKFAYTTGNVECTNCPSGYLQDKPAQAECVQVEPGQVVADGGSASISVPLGSKICSVDPPCECDKCASFEACKEGTKGEEPPSRQCITCEAGKSSSKAATSCVACDKGKFSADGEGPCEECSAGYFQDQNTNPSESCEECPAGWSQSNQGQSLCVSLNWKKPSDCTNDQYLDNRVLKNPSNWSCVTCPQGGACNGPITWSTLGPLFGWWKLPESERPSDKLMFTKCLHPPACLGSANPEFRGKFEDKHGTDLSEKVVNATNTTCAINLGFRNESRLCHTCSSTNRRKG